MAQKYMSYNKVLLTFTVPTDIKEKSIKNGRYSKLRKLIKIRAYIAKLLNNSSDIKYFMNIELGEHYSNPHLHLQLWIKNSDTSSITTNIYEKTISKFDLNKNRCYITEPTHAIPIYNYVIKDYAKDLTDKQIWDLETQKKRFRKIMDSKVRFYSKSKDSYCKSIYRKLWYGLGIVRDKANKFLDFFINKFFFFNKRNLPKISSLVIKFSILSNKEQDVFLFDSFLLIIDVLFYSPSKSPPDIYVLFIYASENLILKRTNMSRYRGKQALLIKPIIEATKEKIIQRLNGENEIEYYLQYYKDYFGFRAIDIKVNGYSNVTSALNKLCENKISINGEVDLLLEKSSFNGRGSYARFVLPKDKLISLIEKTKEVIKEQSFIDSF